MREPNKSSAWQRSSIGRGVRWLFSWRGMRRILIVAAWTATLLAVIYGEENWRGRRAWNRYRQGLEARGEQLDFKGFIPKAIPAEQNFAATPFFDHVFASKTNRHNWDDAIARAGSRVSGPKLKGSRAGRRAVDLAAWEMVLSEVRAGDSNRHDRIESGKFDLLARSNAAPAVLEALRASEPVFVELRAAGRRIGSRYPVRYDLEDPWGILLPHLVAIKSVAQRLQLKACAELALNRSPDGLQDVRLILRLADSLKEESFLISHLLRLACFQIAVQPIWEGLSDHRWSDAQLLELQAQLQQYDFLGDASHALDGERAGGIWTVDLLHQRKYTLNSLLDDSELGSHPIRAGFARFLGRIAPRGWFYLEQVNYCRLFELQLGGTFDLATRRVFPGQTKSNAQEMERTIAGDRVGKSYKAVLNHQVIAALLLPALDKTIRKAATAQTTADEAVIACALERFRMSEGRLPGTLEALVPRFLERLPHDMISGNGYHYAPRDGGHFVLYSVGWDEKDDGGVTGRVLFDDTGDWVWEYP